MPDPWGDTSGTSSGYDPNNRPGGFLDSVRDWWNRGYTNDPNNTGGGGGGGLGLPSAGAKVATAASKTSAILPWLQFAYAVMEGQKSGNFIMPPMTPEQRQMFDYATSILKGTPQQASYAFPILGYDLGHPATLDMAALKRGDVGFTPAGHMSSDALAKILSRAQQPPQTSSTTGDGSMFGGMDGPLRVGGGDNEMPSHASTADPRTNPRIKKI